MEQAQTQGFTHAQPTSESVGFPPQSHNNPPKKGGFPKFLLFGFLGLILIGGAAFFVLRGGDEDDGGLASPTPRVQGLDFIATPTPIVSVTPTPAAVNKDAISVQILNGTGIPGEAGYLETQIKSMGYTKTTTGNATGPTVTTTSMTYGSSVPSTAVDEIKAKLESIYKTVEAKAGGAGSDVKIVVGLRKGATAKPAATTSATTAPKPTGSASPSPTGSSSPKPTAQ